LGGVRGGELSDDLLENGGVRRGDEGALGTLLRVFDGEGAFGGCRTTGLGDGDAFKGCELEFVELGVEVTELTGGEVVMSAAL
jgi:hypothetical protein